MSQSRGDRDGRVEPGRSSLPAGRSGELELLRAAVDTSPDPILFVDRGSLRVIAANPAACRSLGYAAEELWGLDLERIVAKPPQGELAAAMDAAIRPRSDAATMPACFRSRSGEMIPVAWHLREVRGAGGPWLVVVARPEASGAALAAGDRQDQTEGGCDALTGLPDRRQLERRLAAALEAAARRPERAFALLFVDLDGFKAVNDRFGHLAGDGVLREIVGRLTRCLRSGDLVARFGGDEFAVLLDGIRDPQGAVRVAERIQAQLESPATVEGCEVAITASIGIALSSRGYTSPEKMLHDADRAMYNAKAVGRASYAVFREDRVGQAGESEREGED